MSIFPKRTVAGGSVTIHWNLNASGLVDDHLFPFVRIGVMDPAGNRTILFEEHVPVLPSAGSAVPPEMQDEKTLLYLNKNLPMIILADYLAGRHKKEKLIDILKNIHSGRHYYFTFPVCLEALPGKYTLLSEMFINGKVKYSGTSSDDFFYVEKVSVVLPADTESPSDTSVITNHSPEPLPVKILSYEPGKQTASADIEVFEMQPNESVTISQAGKKKYLSYNEERIIVPLSKTTSTRCIRNQEWLSLEKSVEGEDCVYVVHRELDVSYKLHGATKAIWQSSDGLTTRECIQNSENRLAYDEMLVNGLIIELQH